MAKLLQRQLVMRRLSCVMRLATDVIPSGSLSPAQAKVYAVLRGRHAYDSGVTVRAKPWGER